MTTARKAPLDRTLTLVRALADSVDGLTLDEMGYILGQHRRSAERTRDVIALHFDLDEIEDGRKKRFRIRDSLRRHYVRPTATELAALQAEVTAASKAGSPRAEMLNPLLAKLRASLDDREKYRIDPDFNELARLQRTLVGPGAVAPVSPDVLATISQSIMAGQCIQFDYRREGEKEAVWRRVIPHGILHGSVSYLVGAFPKDGHGLVTYRLDRIENPQVSDVAGCVTEGFNIDEWLAGSFGIFRDATYNISLRILPDFASRAKGWRFHPKQVSEDLRDGSIRVTFSTGGLLEIANHLFSWAGELQIEGPPELQQVMAQRLKLCRVLLSAAE